MKVGDKVMFTSQVVKQCGHDKTVADMRGIVESVNGNIARIDTKGTFPNEVGWNIRSIPVKNLKVID